MSYAKRMIAAALVDGDLNKYLGLGNVGALFDFDPAGKPAFDFVQNYIELTGQLPTLDLVEEECAINFTTDNAALEFLHEKAQETHVQRSMKKMVADAKEDFSENPFKALGQMEDAIFALRAQQNSAKVKSFKNAYDTLWPWMVNKWTNKDQLVSFGWPYLDNQVGGLQPGDLVSFVGQPAQGKTFFLLWVALHVWRTLKRPVVFVSMEMSTEAIMERLAAMFTETEMNFFKFGQAQNFYPGSKGAKKVSTKAHVKQSLFDLKNSDMPDFWVVDGSIATDAYDVISLVRQYGPSAVFIDGAYVLENKEATGLYDAVARNVKILKNQLAAKLGVPVLCTWQFQNLSKQLKRGEKPNLDHIGYSAAIGQYSSIVIGLFQSEDASNVEKLFQRLMTLLKGRGGEVGEWWVQWNFKKMFFGEAEPAAKIEVYN
jgi:hypothetical protein